MVVKDVSGKIVWLLVVCLILSIVSLATYSWGRYVLFLVAVLVGLMYAIHRKGKILLKADAFQYMFSAFAIYCGVSSLWAISMSDSITMMTTLLSIVICFYPIYIYYRDCGTVEQLVSAIKWGAVSVSLYTIIFYGLDTLIASAQASNLRIANDFANANTLGLCASVGIIIQSWQLLFHKSRKWEVLTFLPLIVVMGASQSRKAVVFVLTGIFLLFLLRYREEKKLLKTLLSVLIASLVMVGILYIASKMEIFAGMAERMQKLLNSFIGSGKVDRSTQIRNALKDLGIKWWMKKPLFGFGLANPHIIAGQYLDYNTYLHNNYVELLCGGGIAGFALYYSMHIYCIKHLFRLRKVNEPLSALMFTWCLLMLVMDYGKVSYYSKIDVFYLMTVFLSVEEMKRRQKRKNSMEKQG